VSSIILFKSWFEFYFEIGFELSTFEIDEQGEMLDFELETLLTLDVYFENAFDVYLDYANDDYLECGFELLES
jgi:hypothetical protein